VRLSVVFIKGNLVGQNRDQEEHPVHHEERHVEWWKMCTSKQNSKITFWVWN